MKGQNIEEKPKISKISRAILSLLVVGFSIISILNVYKFLVVLFGLSMAVLISSTLEITRLACLYTFLISRKGITSLAVSTYVIVVMVILFGNINSFTCEIIKRDRAGQAQYREQTHKVKQVYSERMDEKLAALGRDIRYLENMVAKYHGRDYWNRRLSQVRANRDKLITERDAFLSSQPRNPEQWVTAKSALLGLELDNPSRDSEDMISVTQALKELWGLEKTTAQKIMGIVVTVTVELSILLLSFLANAGVKSRSVTDVKRSRELSRASRGMAKVRKNHGSQRSVTKRVTSREELLNMVIPDIDEMTLGKFVAVNREHFERTGELLPMRKLSMRLRPVRNILGEFDQESLAKLFEK